jgi:DNA polymerase-3 subunit epsilon
VLAEGVQLAKKLTASVTHLAHDDSVSPAEPRLARAAELGAEVVAVGEATVALGFEAGAGSGTGAARGSRGEPELGAVEVPGAAPVAAWASDGEPGWPEVEPTEAVRWVATEVVRLPASAEVPLPQEETRRFAPVAVPAPRVEPVPRAAVSSAVPRPAPRSRGSATADPPPAGLAGVPRRGSAKSPAKVASTVAGRVMMGIGLVLMFITLAAMFGGAGVGAGIFLAVIGVGLLVGGWLVGEKGQRGGQPSVDA